MNLPQVNKPRIVIVGGGFAGMYLAKNLRNAKAQVVLIDKNNFHTFQPLLYQVATAGLEPDSVTYPLRKVFNHYDNFFFRIASVKGVDIKSQVLRTDKGSIEYDYLVIATGAETNYFGNDQIAHHAMPMKSIREALDLRSLILQNFEEALLTDKVIEREKLMNIAIVGGGPTGVELAGALAELRKWILPKDYPDLDFRQMTVHLLEGQDRLLAAMSEEASDKAAKFLEKMDVQIWLSTLVQDFDGDKVSTNTGKQFPAKTLIWAAGVKGAPIDGLDTVKNGRIAVDENLRTHQSDNVFVIGDLASIQDNEQPMLASVACQQGIHLAKNFKLMLAGKPMKKFQYNDKGTMATIGRNRAVADLPGIKLQGRMAWYIWMLVHLILLVGFRNRIVALFNWVWSYINYDSGIRLIIRPFKRKKPIQEEAI